MAVETGACRDTLKKLESDLRSDTMKIEADPMDPVRPEARRLTLDEVLAEQQAAAREQLESLWRTLNDAYQESLAGWTANLSRRVAAMLAEEQQAGRREGRRELTEKLHQAVRRLRNAESRSEWAAALLDAAAPFCDRAIVLAWRGETLEWVGARGLDPEVGEAMASWRGPLEAAPAIRSVLSAGEPLAVSRSPEELSREIFEALGDAGSAQIWLLPILGRGRVAAVLLAGGCEAELDAGGLELAAAMAGATPAGPGWPPLEAPAPVRAPELPPRALPEWSQLSREDQELHLRAQRFARVQVAEIRLHQAQAVQTGRARGDLYGVLKTEIDAAREAFRTQFLEASPTMVDYLHRELVRTLAHEDAALLGKDYPGPLV